MSSKSEDDEPVFRQCDDCGSVYPAFRGHYCHKTPTKTADTRETVRERIEAIEAIGDVDENRIVLVSTNHRRRAAYHKPLEAWVGALGTAKINKHGEEKQPVELNGAKVTCETSVNGPWSVIKQERAHEREMYPCGHCWPEVLREVADDRE